MKDDKDGLSKRDHTTYFKNQEFENIGPTNISFNGIHSKNTLNLYT